MTPAPLLRRGLIRALKRSYSNRALALDGMTRPLLTSSSRLLLHRKLPHHLLTCGHGRLPERPTSPLDQRPRQVPHRAVPRPRPKFAPFLLVPGYVGLRAAVMFTIFVAERTRAPPVVCLVMTFTAKQLRLIRSVNSPVAPAFFGWSTVASSSITVDALTRVRQILSRLATLRLRHPHIVTTHLNRW